MTNLPYKVIQELSMHTNKKCSLWQHFLSPIAQVTSINTMFHFCSIWLRSCFRILLHINAEIAMASVLGQLHYWNQERKWKCWKVLQMGLLEWTPKRNKRPKTEEFMNVRTNFQASLHLQYAMWFSYQRNGTTIKAVTKLVFYQMAVSEIAFTRSNWPEKRSDIGGALFAGSNRGPFTRCTSRH